jgi:hypothetical protein
MDAQRRMQIESVLPRLTSGQGRGVERSRDPPEPLRPLARRGAQRRHALHRRGGEPGQDRCRLHPLVRGVLLAVPLAREPIQNARHDRRQHIGHIGGSQGRQRVKPRTRAVARKHAVEHHAGGRSD